MPIEITITFHEAPASMPAESCDVLVFCESSSGLYYGSSLSYSLKNHAFGCRDQSNPETVSNARRAFSDVKYWAYMSEVYTALISAAGGTEQ